MESSTRTPANPRPAVLGALAGLLFWDVGLAVIAYYGGRVAGGPPRLPTVRSP